jgi:hypothetical protein
MTFEFAREGTTYRFHTEVGATALKDAAHPSHATRCVLDAKEQEEASMEPQDEQD